MDDATKSWVMIGHDALNQVALLNQIEKADVNQLTHKTFSLGLISIIR